MGVHHLYYRDCRNVRPVKASVRLRRDWIVCRSKDQAVRSIQIDRQLEGSVACQLMAATRQAAHSVETGRGAKVVQPSANQLRSLGVVLPDELFEIVANAFQIAVFELNVHFAPWIYILTVGVNKVQALFSPADENGR